MSDQDSAGAATPRPWKVEQAIEYLRDFIGVAHPYDDEAGEAYCDYCNLRTPHHRDSCQWVKYTQALDAIEAALSLSAGAGEDRS